MLKYISNNAFWSGEPINGIKHPSNIEELWSSEELAIIGLSKYVTPIAPATAETLTTEHVVAERERRLALGFDYNFGDIRGIHRIGTTEQDMKGWDEVTKATQAFIALGQPSTTLTIVTNAGPATITALEWQQILVAATMFRQPIWSASFVIQSMNPIPSDYTNDLYWSL